MVDRNNGGYVAGRGIPSYLLDRVDNDSSIYSDGASRIFNETYSSIATATDTDPSNTSNIVHSSSSFTMTSISRSPTTLSSCVLNSSQYKLNSSISLDLDGADDTRTTINDDTSISDKCSINTIYRRPNEVSMLSNMSLMDTSCNIPICLTKDDDYNTSALINDNDTSVVFTDPEDMFPPYVPLLSQDEDEAREERQLNNQSKGLMNSDEVREDNDHSVLRRVELVIPNYDECCLRGNPNVTICGSTSHNYPDWPPTCISFSKLGDIDIRSYLKRKKVISKIEEDNLIVNERNLIANRLRSKDIFIDDSMAICPKHRSSYGINWYDSKSTCHHRDHESEYHYSSRDCRRANITTCFKIEGFPVGGRLCTKHRKQVLAISEDISIGPITVYSNITGESEFALDDSRALMNRVLTQVNLSPIRSQTRKRLDQHSNSGLRRISSKLTNTVRVIQKKMAEALAPGQGDQLLQIAGLDPQINNNEVLDQAIDNEMIKNLKKIYDLYIEQKMPFVEQLRLLSLLPRSWSYEKTMELFNCSRHAIKIAHRMYDEQQYMLKRDSEPSIRQQADPEKVKHFVNWLVESNTLVSGTYGLTVLRMDNGDKYELPKQILQLQKSHVLVNYQKYCDETDFQGFGRSKLYDILNSIKPTQQRAVAGLDEFVVEGVEAWSSLSTMVEEMAIPQADRRRLLKQMEMAENYQKSRHTGHCTANSNCTSHCTTFALSDPNCAEHYSSCSQEHMSICSECSNIIRTLDEIKENVDKISDPDLHAEVRYDFENAAEHIIEWSRHNIRSAQQDHEKTKIISKMEIDEAFCTFDWGQKILPQEHRESQKKYFGKKGMSVFIGSFVWKNKSTSPVENDATTNTSSTRSFATESYIVALTNASQTEIDTLSAGEIILKQFQADYPHIKTLHKRTDNAGNFSSHGTPEAERVICQRLGLDLLTRDYSEVQKGKDICDRICGVAKDRMRSWIATGNNLLHAHDIKEGMEHAGGIKNTKIAVAEMIPGAGYLGKNNVPNVSSIRSVRYEQDAMKVYKASNIGSGISIKYKGIEFENNMRVTSPFTVPINSQSPGAIPKRRIDRQYHDLSLCPVHGCTATFESRIELDAHIAANLHTVPNEVPRTANDIARVHLREILRSTLTRSRKETDAICEYQDSTTDNMSISFHKQFFSTCGWALRTRKLGKPMSKNVKNFIEQAWLDSIKTNSRIIPENIQQQIRTKRDQNGQKFFQIDEYPTKNQIKYQFRKLNQKYDITMKQQLIVEIIDENIDSQ